VDKKRQQIICTAFTNGKRHDFRLFKESKTQIHPGISVVTDTGYQGLKKIHAKTQMPKKRSKKNPLRQLQNPSFVRALKSRKTPRIAFFNQAA